MATRKNTLKRRKSEQGQALTEYALIVGLALGALFLPLFNGRSIILLLIDVFDIYINSFHQVITLPIP
ncbi:MAG: hypothetical protein QGI45_10500 [Myxococcota bacterium]|jgi:hypothetical protein|nr:hypothetical protein [Myxococcota bacterium]